MLVVWKMLLSRNPSGVAWRLSLAPQQKPALVVFLKKLANPNLATDEKYSTLFDYGN